MFTGIIETTGTIRTLRRMPQGSALAVSAGPLASELRAGDSVAVNGVCLTVTAADSGSFTADLSLETLERTTLGSARAGLTVNLERPLTPSSRMGGHFVQGHVDGIGRLLSVAPSGSGTVIAVEFPHSLERYLVHKGSVALDGISLTIARLEGNVLSVAVIPYTLRATNLQHLLPGDAVNIETDLLGKYFERFFQLGLARTEHREVTIEYLKEQGF